MTPVDVLCWASSAGALVGGGSYIYGYIIKSKGTRRLHTCSLLFSGFGIANLPVVIRQGAEGPALMNASVVVLFLLAGVLCQSATAFRGRRSDRRAPREAEATAGAAPEQPQPIAA